MVSAHSDYAWNQLERDTFKAQAKEVRLVGVLSIDRNDLVMYQYLVPTACL